MSKEDIERLDDQVLSAWDRHDADAFVSLFADDFVWVDWTVPEPIRDGASAREYFNGWMTAIPDMRVKLTSRVVGEDSVATEVEFAGTNSGPLAMAGKEIPATNKPVTGRGSYIARFRDGKIVEYRTYPDVAGLMMQMGLMPQM